MADFQPFKVKCVDNAGVNGALTVCRDYSVVGETSMSGAECYIIGDDNFGHNRPYYKNRFVRELFIVMQKTSDASTFDNQKTAEDMAARRVADDYENGDGPQEWIVAKILSHAKMPPIEPAPKPTPIVVAGAPQLKRVKA